MDRNELKKRISDLTETSREIDKISELSKALRSIANNPDCGRLDLKAVAIGYAELFEQTYNKLQYMWVNLYRIEEALKEDEKEATDETV